MTQIPRSEAGPPPPRAGGKRHGPPWWEVLLLGGGLLLFVALIYAANPAEVLRQLGDLGWLTVLAVLPYFTAYAADTLGWWWVLTHAFAAGAFRVPSLPRLFALRASGEAINGITPTAYLGGEPLKAWLLRRHGVPLAPGLASALASKTALMLTQGLFVFLGVLIAIQAWRPSIPLPLVMGIGLTLMVLVAAAIIAAQRHRPFTVLLAVSRRWSGRRALLAAWEDDLTALDDMLREFYDRRTGDFLVCCGFHFTGWTLGSVEVWLLLWLLGAPVDFTTAFSIEGLAGVAKLAALIVPASLGVQEGGQILIFVAFGLGPSRAITFSLIRRARELVWIAFGLAVLWREQAAARRERLAPPRRQERQGNVNGGETPSGPVP
ncbi:MAG: flippase-like domain-containing protein [Candidatus Methylomirabilales bacterium]